jgi:hypothetical protein
MRTQEELKSRESSDFTNVSRALEEKGIYLGEENELNRLLHFWADSYMLLHKDEERTINL